MHTALPSPGLPIADMLLSRTELREGCPLQSAHCGAEQGARAAVHAELVGECDARCANVGADRDSIKEWGVEVGQPA